MEDYLNKRGDKLPKTESPWPSTYRPGVDVSPKLGAYEAAFFQLFISVLRLIFELVHSDLEMETLAMTLMMTLPCKGHIKVLFRMFALLNNKHNSPIFHLI